MTLLTLISNIDIHTLMLIVIFGLVLALVAFVWSVAYLTKAGISFIRKEYSSDKGIKTKVV